MYHSITFAENLSPDPFNEGDINTWEDWHLIPSTRPLFNPPQVKTQFTDIPGMNGALDFTTFLTPHPKYTNRTGSIEFIVDHRGNWGSWATRYSQIMGYLHGKKLYAVLEDDRSYYYEGRFSVNEWKSDQHYSTITIDYNLYPFKRYVIDSMSPWLWDPFDFETGFIDDPKKGISIKPGTSEPRTVKLYGGNVPSYPIVRVYNARDNNGSITTNSDILLANFTSMPDRIHQGDLKIGYNEYIDFVIEPGENTYLFGGNVDYSYMVDIIYAREFL